MAIKIVNFSSIHKNLIAIEGQTVDGFYRKLNDLP